jgi:hypothetical protein
MGAIKNFWEEVQSDHSCVVDHHSRHGMKDAWEAEGPGSRETREEGPAGSAGITQMFQQQILGAQVWVWEE